MWSKNKILSAIAVSTVGVATIIGTSMMVGNGNSRFRDTDSLTPVQLEVADREAYFGKTMREEDAARALAKQAAIDEHLGGGNIVDNEADRELLFNTIVDTVGDTIKDIFGVGGGDDPPTNTTDDPPTDGGDNTTDPGTGGGGGDGLFDQVKDAADKIKDLVVGDVGQGDGSFILSVPRIAYCALFENVLGFLDMGLGLPLDRLTFLCAASPLTPGCNKSTDVLFQTEFVCKRLVGTVDAAGSFWSGTDWTCTELCIAYNALFCSRCDE